MSKGTVCHITSVHPRYDGRIFQRECRSLAKEGYQVFLLVSGTAEPEVREGVTIISAACAKGRIRRILTSASKMFRPALEIGADIYHIHDPELLPLALKLRKHGKHVVYDSHEFYYYQIKQKNYLPQIIRNIVAGMYRWYEKKVLSQIDAVITPCTINGENYFEKIAKKTVLVDNRPSRDYLTSVPYEIKKLPVKCCYTGSLTKARGLVEMLDATKKADIPLLLAGNFDPGLQEELRDQLEEENVCFKGYVDLAGIQKIYDEAHIGLSLLHNTGQYGIADNLSTKIYEYMLAGIPVVLEKRPYTERFIGKYPVGILVASNNINEIIQAIAYLKEHLQEAKEMGEKGRKAVIEELCWEKETEKIFKLYNEMLR